MKKKQGKSLTKPEFEKLLTKASQPLPKSEPDSAMRFPTEIYQSRLNKFLAVKREINKEILKRLSQSPQAIGRRD